MLGGRVDATTLVAALGAGPPPPECRWGRRPHRGATACRLLLTLAHARTILYKELSHPIGEPARQSARKQKHRFTCLGCMRTNASRVLSSISKSSISKDSSEAKG